MENNKQETYRIYIYDNKLQDDKFEKDNGRTKALREIIRNEIVKNKIIAKELISVNREVYINKPQCGCTDVYCEKICPNSCPIEGGMMNGEKIFHDLICPLILFIHTSNKCFYRFASEFLQKKRIQCYIVCYSGYDENEVESYAKLKKSFNTNNVKFFSLSQYIQTNDLRQKWDIKAFVEAVIQNEANPFDKLVRKTPSHLIALSILCQGYLAAHGTEDFKVSNNELQKKAENNKGTTDLQNWWEPAFADVFEEVKENDNKIKSIKAKITFEKTALYNELESLGKECKDANAIKDLFDAIKGVGGQNVDAKKVIAAYGQLT